MKDNFWKTLPKPFFALAPMEDVTDVVFRNVIASAARPDVFFTEFTNSESFVLDPSSLRGRLAHYDHETPLVAHIWGDNPEHFRSMSIGVAKMGFQGVDINMGCPAPNVFKHGRGSGLILRPNVAADLIQASKAGGIPVSVKTRLGHAKVDEFKVWIRHLLEQDVANITIHLRTKTEMSKVDAHWDVLPDILALRDEIAPDTLITANGDIKDYKMGMQLVDQYGVDGVMIGRGIFHNPYAFEKEPVIHSTKELFDLFRYHLDQYDQHTQKEHGLRKPLHRFFKVYLREFDGVGDLRERLLKTKDSEEVRALLDEFEANHDL